MSGAVEIPSTDPSQEPFLTIIEDDEVGAIRRLLGARGHVQLELRRRAR